MQQLGLSAAPAAGPRKGFWKRQFDAQPTACQEVFDWILGVFLPLFCFVFDPTVFKGVFGPALLGAYRPFAYLLSFAAVMAMAAWLIWGARLKWLGGFLAGLFFASAAVAALVGLILLPFSLIGLIVLIGALGFTPFFAAFVYLRNGVRSARAARPFLEKSVQIYAVAFGAIFSTAVPWTVNAEFARALEAVATGDAQIVREQIPLLGRAAPLVYADPVGRAYYNTNPETPEGAEKRRALAELYQALTGEPVERWSSRSLD